MTTLEVYLDAITRTLCDKNGNAWNQRLPFIRGDDLLLCINYVTIDRSVNPMTVTAKAITAGTTFLLSGKKKGAQNGTLLVRAGADAFNVDGDWAFNLAAGKICVRIALKLPALVTALGSSASLACSFDIEATEPGGSVSTLWLQDVPVLADDTRGDEDVSAETAPTYYTKAEVDAQIAAAIAAVISPNTTILEEGGDLVWRWNGIEIQRRSAS